MLHSHKQGSTAPSDYLGAQPSAPVSQGTAGCRPLHFLSLPVLNVLYPIKKGGKPPQHEDPDGGAAPRLLKPLSNPAHKLPVKVLASGIPLETLMLGDGHGPY